MKIATDPNSNLDNVNYDVLFGCGLPGFDPVYTTIEAVAKLIQWQCCGVFSCHTIVDSEELNDLAHIARKKFLIV